MKPKISIIVPLYNKERYVSKSIQSILDQTFKDFEILVINDGSTDESRTIVSKIADERIRIFDKENGGVSSARNKGIELARAEWIFFLDGDDTMRPNCLEVLYELHRQYPAADVCTANYTMLYPGCRALDYCIGKNNYLVENNFRDFWKGKFYMRTGIMIVRKRVFDNVGGFNVNTQVYEDIELFFKIMKSYTIAYSKENVFTYIKEASDGSQGVSPRKKLYKVDLDGTTGYERLCKIAIIVEEIILCRKHPKMIRSLVHAKFSNKLRLVLCFIPCFVKAAMKAQVFERFLKKVRIK